MCFFSRYRLSIVLSVAFLSSTNYVDCLSQSVADTLPPISIGITGDAADVQTPTEFGVVLMGGNTDVDAAINWMIDKSGGGDFVVIRATGSTGYNDYIKQLGKVNSVETLLIDSRAKANSPEAYEKIKNAEALFIAGGDQSNYVNFWADTEVSHAIRFLIETKKVPIGGTSAGCAVLSDFIFDAKKGGVTSSEALRNPYDSLVSVSKSFIGVPVLKNVLADQHYSQRTRQGRHVVFLARAIKDFGVASPMGVGVDEKTAVAIEENGNTKIFGFGAAYFLYSTSVPELCEANKPLVWNRSGKAIHVFVRMGSPAGTVGMNLLQKPRSRADQYWSVVGGELQIN